MTPPRRIVRLERKTDGSGRFAESRLRILHSEDPQRFPQALEHLVETPIDMEQRGEAHEPGYLAGGKLFRESKTEQEPVAWLQSLDCLRQRPPALGPGEHFVRRAMGGSGQECGVYMVRHEVHEPSPARTLVS